MAGLALASAGLGLLAGTPVAGSDAVALAPAMSLIAVGGGLAFLPLILIAVGDARPQDAGLASGLVSTSQMVGGAVGLAVLVTVAAARTAAVGAAGDAAALDEGDHAAFLVAGAATVAGLVLAMRPPAPGAPPG